MHKTGARDGQFTVITAGVLAVILLSAVMATYALVRNQPFQKIPGTSSTITEMNSALNGILKATVGYYGSILQVSGNTTFAKQQASSYVQSGFIQIARTHPQWSPNIRLTSFTIATSWFGPASYSQATMVVTYSIASIGLTGFTLTISASLTTNIQSASASAARIQVLQEGGQPELALTASSFQFLIYSQSNSTWTPRISSSAPRIFSNGSYDVTFPSGIDPTNFLVQVTDPRGILTVASSLAKYTYTFSWNSLYSTLTQDTMTVELLQNGTMRWLGQSLYAGSVGRPIPPMPVRSLRVNETIGGANQQVPFQVEDWGSSFRVAVGMSNPLTLMGPREMIVFLVTHKVSAVTLWWDGRDIANQTTYASQDKYFTADNPGAGVLSNGILTLNIGTFSITATSGSSSTTANFMRINGQNSAYGASASYVIYQGVVRDIIQQEAEFAGGAPNAPNVYVQITVTFPANATYYTYLVRTIFTASSVSRSLTDLSVLQLSIGTGSAQTENGTSAGVPVVSTTTGNFWDQSWSGFPTGWMHHFSEYVSVGGNGGGILMTDAGNRNLYAFDPIAGGKTAALNVASANIEVDPVRIRSASFTTPLDVMFIGAVVTFNGASLIPTSGNIGLWMMGELLPTVTVS